MSESDPDVARRAASRSDWPVRVYRLGEEPGDSLVRSTTAEERVAMMWPLALEAWSLTGRPFPEYERSSAPVRVLDHPPHGNLVR